MSSSSSPPLFLCSAVFDQRAASREDRAEEHHLGVAGAILPERQPHRVRSQVLREGKRSAHCSSFRFSSSLIFIRRKLSFFMQQLGKTQDTWTKKWFYSMFIRWRRFKKHSSFVFFSDVTQSWSSSSVCLQFLHMLVKWIWQMRRDGVWHVQCALCCHCTEQPVRVMLIQHVESVGGE